MSKKLWGKEQEKKFFKESLDITNPESLFYLTKDGKFYAYWPKKYQGPKTTLQSRNSLIGCFTEKWTTDLFREVASEVDGFSVQGVVCEEIGLTRQSPADVAICKKKGVIQKPQDILMIIEVKMSVVWNWQLMAENSTNFKLLCLGDYKSHQGNPGLLRSDTMLKAIGKSINVRVSSFAASKIPIVVLGNTPITKSYEGKVDHLKNNGIIQGFWSVNHIPLDKNGKNIKSTPRKGFYRFDNYEMLKQRTLALLAEEREFFSSMQSKKRLGEIIEIANRESTYETKAQRFLELVRSSNQ